MSLQRLKHSVLALALAAPLALFSVAPGPVAAASPNPGSDPSHPWIMQEAAKRVASAQTGPLKPFEAPAPQAAVGGSGGLKREVFGFALASSLGDPSIGYPTWNFSLLSTVAFFGLHVNDDGTLAADAGSSVWNSSQLTGLLAAAHSHGTRVVVTLIMQDFTSGTPHMCSALALAARTVAAAVAEVSAKGVDGINLDYEGLNGSCGVATDPSWARHSFTNFVAALRAALPAGSYLSVDTYAGSAADPLGFFDVPALNAGVDSFFVMAYDLEYSNYSRWPTSCQSFCLGPTAPLAVYYYNDTGSVTQYTAVVPASKVILGVPYYGRKACTATDTPNENPTSAVVADGYLDASGESTAPGVGPGSFTAHRDAIDPSGQVRWDTWFNTSMSCIRELYWDDAVSLGHKYDLVNATNLRGVGMWTLNYGGGAPELWNELAVKFAYIPSAPGNLAAYSQDSSATVSWSPAVSVGGPILSYTILASPGGATATVPGSAPSAVVHGLTNGTSYTFTVTAANSYGPGIVSAASNPVVPGKPAVAWYFPWYDFATPGIQSDYFAVGNPGPAWANVLIQLPGAVPLSFGVPHGTAKYVSFPPGSSGGPVTITTDGEPVVVSQRVVFNQSANETAATPASALSTTLVWPWYDWATPGFQSDYFYIGNPGGTAANITISMPGAATLHLTVAAGGGGFTTFPHGTASGGPTLTSDQPVVATQRVVWGDSFTDIPASLPSSEGKLLAWPIYDWTGPDFGSDYFYIANPNPSPAHITISVPGATSITATVQAGTATFRSFPFGTAGGPVTMTSDQPVLASQRILFDRSAMETPASPATSAATSFHFPWYEWSGSDLQSVYFYVANPGPNWANILISMPGAPLLSFGVPRGTTRAVAWPRGTGGGPVTVTTDGQPVFISQRTVFDQSAYELLAPPGS